MLCDVFNMHAQSEVNLEIQASSENVFTKDGDIGISSSSSMAAVSRKPVKKPTRQWAAWTRQEEENFFNALRQVGKNFEKITCRVQSKNRDQVRHYYYRLVRRMNKLLGPEFCLDAKNTQDTNAAMLRWWSLLEKYSCTASKLHLKPRRFKTFIEALAHQLLKDRNKTRRKRPLLGETCSTPSTTDSLFCKAPGNDVRPVKLLVADGQSIQNIGSTKSASLKRSVSANIHSNKGDLATMKTMRQRRRTGGVASAAYKRWEKAAIAGVSLVADAAEQLERTSNDVNSSYEQGTLGLLSHDNFMTKGKKNITYDGKKVHPLPYPSSRWMCSQHQIRETNIQPLMKLKLQLFPIDESTRKALEKDEHNPHLELTLSARKRISSILEHLNRKWGNSSIASGELMLFPYSIQQDDIASSQRWTLKDSCASAADVYANIGSPAIFRLRYGWFSNAELVSRIVRFPCTSVHLEAQAKDTQEGHVDIDVSDEKTMKMDASGRPSPPISDIPEQSTKVKTAVILPELVFRGNLMDSNVKHQETLQHAATSSWIREEIGDGGERKEDKENHRRSNGALLSASEWADSLTNISIGDLLSGSSRAAESCMDPPPGGRTPSLQHIPFSCDSFDAAISAHISAHQNLPILSSRVSHASIWDAEETCDEFSFQSIPSLNREDPNLNRNEPSPLSKTSNGDSGQNNRIDSNGFRGLLKDFADVEPLDDRCYDSDMKANSQSDEEMLSSHNKYDPAKNLGLTDIYWPDSLGPFELDIPSSRYQGEDLIFGESVSLSGLSRLIASSLDAFQNCSFFGIDKKESSANEAQGAFSLSDDKLGSDS